MKKIMICLFGAFALLFASGAYAQKTMTVKPSKNYISASMAEIAPFTSVMVMDDIDVEFRQGPMSAVTMYGSDNLVALVDVSVMDGVATVKFSQPIRIKGEARLKVSLSGPTLEMVKVQNDGDFEIEGPLTSSNLELHAMGLGDISADSIQASSVVLHATGRGDIDVEGVMSTTLQAKAEGRSDIDVSGAVKMATLSNMGSGELDAEHLRAFSVNAMVNGAGDIKCYASSELKATANGSGKILYKGFPVSLNKMGKANKIMQD